VVKYARINLVQNY